MFQFSRTLLREGVQYSSSRSSSTFVDGLYDSPDLMPKQWRNNQRFEVAANHQRNDGADLLRDVVSVILDQNVADAI